MVFPAIIRVVFLLAFYSEIVVSFINLRNFRNILPLIETKAIHSIFSKHFTTSIFLNTFLMLSRFTSASDLFNPFCFLFSWASLPACLLWSFLPKCFVTDSSVVYFPSPFKRWLIFSFSLFCYIAFFLYCLTLCVIISCDCIPSIFWLVSSSLLLLLLLSICLFVVY